MHPSLKTWNFGLIELPPPPQSQLMLESNIILYLKYVLPKYASCETYWTFLRRMALLLERPLNESKKNIENISLKWRPQFLEDIDRTFKYFNCGVDYVSKIHIEFQNLFKTLSRGSTTVETTASQLGREKCWPQLSLSSERIPMLSLRSRPYPGMSIGIGHGRRIRLSKRDIATTPHPDGSPTVTKACQNPSF